MRNLKREHLQLLHMYVILEHNCDSSFIVWRTVLQLVSAALLTRMGRRVLVHSGRMVWESHCRVLGRKAVRAGCQKMGWVNGCGIGRGSLVTMEIKGQR